MSQTPPSQQSTPDYSGMDISMCPVHNKTSQKFIDMAQSQSQNPSQPSPTTLSLSTPPSNIDMSNMDISMCPVHNGGATNSMMSSSVNSTTIPPPSHSHMGLDMSNMDISMCPVHNGNNKSVEAFTALAQYQRQQHEDAIKQQQEKLQEKQRAYQHVSSSKFLEGAPRFPAAKVPVETQDDSVVGDVFPDSKPIFGQRYLLSTSPAQSSIPKSQRSKALPSLQLPEQAPQVPENLKNVAQNIQEQLPGSNTKPACTSDEAADVAYVNGQQVALLPGKDYKDETWTFPSHQRFYNAMKKKGWAADEIDIPYIVSIHNTINQQAWSKIMQYERFHKDKCPTPSLLKFQGRPNDLSPKAHVLSTIGYNAPYDRHDWTIDRCGKDVRYVIDFYDGPQSSVDIEKGQVLATHLDVRPALDTPGAFFDRLRFSFEGFFAMKSLDNAVVDKPQQQKKD